MKYTIKELLDKSFSLYKVVLMFGNKFAKDDIKHLIDIVNNNKSYNSYKYMFRIYRDNTIDSDLVEYILNKPHFSDIKMLYYYCDDKFTEDQTIKYNELCRKRDIWII